MDAARCAKRLGAENVYIVYRRGMAELPARKEEVEHAEEEGIVFKTLTNPTEVLGDENGWVKGMTCVKMELGEPDASGRRRPIVKEGSEFVLDVDTMIMALGTSPNPLIRSTTPGLDADKHGCLITNGPDGLTSRPMVYAGGDAVTAPPRSFWRWVPAKRLPARLKRPSRRRNSNNKNFPCTFTQAAGEVFSWRKAMKQNPIPGKAALKIVVGSIMAAYGLTLAVYAGFGGATLAIFWK